MKILIFDTETGGLNAYRNDILQLSFQVIDGDTFHTLLESNYYFPWPEDKRRVEWGAIQVNGLKLPDGRNGRYWIEAARLYEWQMLD